MSTNIKEEILAAVARANRIWVPKEVWDVLNISKENKVIWVKRIIDGRVEILLQNSCREERKPINQVIKII